ncbi:choice-of-anchor D domain-containing protein [Winogradskyella bathintestinalis]|uniref:Choice-of-anchor D domain-containing protein n=1 Tax=Winogradskyella bathintestinalis TaxID=3035208 RepID=A0ABT7ZS09_9FLAO|nr:choice-of-anchor D domain-containing protein [Winogradskyella bathintestinalis]MDN3491767.1 choice-of-anchor D domain-containing protein [Winogradskyella bathintestinalis]
MIKNYLFSFLFIGFVFGFGYGQTTIFNVGGGGAYPSASWSDINNVTSNDIDRGTYYLLDAGNPSDLILTAIYDLSSYSSAEFSLDVASFGSGSHNQAKIEISFNGGTTFTQTEVSSTTTGSSYIDGGTFTLNSVTNQVQIRITNNGTSGRGVRLRNLILEASAPTGPTITVAQATGGTISPGTISVSSGDDQDFTATADACYTFNNWVVDGSNAGSINPYSFTNVNDDHDISAVYTPTGNTVMFNNNGGSGTMAPQMDCNPANLTSNTFTNAGFTFNSWNTAANGSGTTYADGALYEFSTDITLFAQWDVFVGPCIGLDDFDSSLPAGYSLVGTYINTGSAYSGSHKIGFNDVGDDLELPTISNPSSLSFWARLSGGSGSQIKAQYDNGGTWTDVGTTQTVTGTSYTQYTFDLSSISGLINVDLRLTMVTDNNSIYLDDLEVYCGPAAAEIEIQGNATEIVDGDATPTIANDTDFGDVTVDGGTATHAFTIYNTGGADLTLDGTAPNYVTVSNTTDFSVSTQPALTTIPDTGTNFTTFQITFDPASLGTQTATVSIANNDSDEDPYTFVIEGNGTNSADSDIIVNGTFTYNSNIDYTAYQVATITNTAQSIDVFKLDIRDGGASNDADSEATELTAITFDVTNLANIRTAALFDGNLLIDNNPTFGAGTISFSGFSQTAADGGSASLTLKVTFLTAVTDNDQLQFTISAATANPSGSIFGATNAGGATSSLTGNRNRIEVIADRLNFLQQPSTTSTNATMSPAVQVEATDVNGNRDLDWTGNISITSDGTMTGDPITVASASSISTFNSITHTAAGTGFTLTASASGLLDDVSNPFDIILFTFNSGDFRPKFATDFSFNGDWEYFDGSAWVNVPDGNAPQNTSVSITRILIDKYVTGGGSSNNNYDCDILILSGGTLELTDDDNPPVSSEFLSSGNTLEVRDGANLIIRGDIDLPSSANFIVRDGGYMTIDQSSMHNQHPMWEGIEKFEGGSMLEINDWDWSVNATQRSLINVITTISDNDNGYKFGNVYFNPSNLTTEWTIVGGDNININVTENDFEINNTSNYFVMGMSNRSAGIASTYNGNIIVSDGNFTFGGSFSNHTFQQNFLIRGDVIINSDDDFYVHRAFNDTPTIVAGSAPVIIEGNLEIGTTVTSVNSDVTTKEILFSGDNNHTIEVAPNCSNVPFKIENGDTAELLIENLKFTGDSSLEIESGATFNFSFNGTTALEVQDISGARNEFISQTNSTLYITHPQGIWDSSSQGNVQDFGSTYTTYNQTANFYYIGKQNQVTGNALTTGSTVKNFYAILDNNTLELRLTNRIGISDGGKLEIQQGIVVGEEAGSNDHDFYGSGRLVMTGGEYRISTITTNQLSDYLPQLSNYSNYDLTDGIVHLNGTGLNNTQILSGVPNYVNLSFSGSNILEGLPPLPPGLPTYKGISSAAGVSNTITISENAIVDVKNFTLGGAGTNLIMEDQCRFIMAGSGTKPDAFGATSNYNLGPDTTIEFNNNGGFESIRLSNPVPSYANIVVSGDNVGTVADGSGANSFIQFQTGGSFMVTETGIFKQSNTNGFSGLANTSISSTNNPEIILRDASTVEYAGDNQSITALTTNQFASNDYYANLTISGTGIKTLGDPIDVFVGEDLTVNSSTLIVKTNEFITVDEGVHVDASANFNIEDSGSLIQINETNTNTGNLTMKRDYNVDSSYDYIYWSSPITGFDTNLLPINNNHIYTWDPIAPNTGTGQGNWISAVNQTMEAGMGYIARNPNSSTTLIFENGVPHSGLVNVNLSRGIDNDGLDGDDDDDDWNLLGNPYPSAISADDFLTENASNNSRIEGFIEIWTHGATPSNLIGDPFYENNNGYNYDTNDYIRYNRTGATEDCRNLPSPCFDGNIAAGQGFMVNMVNGGQTTLFAPIFNNTMRSRAYSNNDFFRSAASTTQNQQENNNEEHRIWLDFTSDNNFADRILLGYVNNATNDKDILYDAIVSNSGDEQNFYFMIANDPYNIQGRGLPFLDTDVVPLGYVSTVPGNYTIAINSASGVFENNQTVYIKDNLLNFVHNLSENPFTFTSEAGEFNSRFEIVFAPNVLSIDENLLSTNDLTIIELQNGNVEFNTNSTQYIITNVEILDVLGRRIYNLKGNNTIETYNLSKLSQSAYVAKITLSNGQVISKKAIKQR